MPVEVTDDEFEAMVARALERIPEEFTSALENCAIVVEDEPAPGRSVLGLYEGVPTTEGKDFAWGMPDVISIYQGPLQRMCHSVEELEHQVYVTVVHEVGHYFGLDDDRLTELRWG